jgi:hypothetical protein
MNLVECVCNDFFPDSEELRNFLKCFSGFMICLKILEIVLESPKQVSGSDGTVEGRRKVLDKVIFNKQTKAN